METLIENTPPPSVEVPRLVRRCRMVIYHPDWPTGARTKWADSEAEFEHAKKRAKDKGCTFVMEYDQPNASSTSNNPR